VTRIIGELQNSGDIEEAKRSEIATDIEKAASPLGSSGVLPQGVGYARSLESLVNAGSGGHHMSSSEDDEDLAERDYRDVAFELLEPLQQHNKKETEGQLDKFLAGHTSDPPTTMKRLDAIIKRPHTHPAVVKLAIRRREEIRRQILEAQIIGNTGSAAVEAALKAIPMQLRRAKESGNILQIEREMENAMEVASLADRRGLEVGQETGQLLQEIFVVQQKLEKSEKSGLADVFQQFPKSTSKEPEGEGRIKVLRYEADIYRSLAAGGPTGANSHHFQSMNASIFTQITPKQKKIASQKAKQRDQEADAELEARRQAQALEDLEEYLDKISQGRYVDPESSSAEDVVRLGEELLPWLTRAMEEASVWGREIGGRAKEMAKRKLGHVRIETFLRQLHEATSSESKNTLFTVCENITAHYTEEKRKDRHHKMPARLLGPINRGRRLVTQWTIKPPTNRDAQTDKIRVKSLKGGLKAAIKSGEHKKLNAAITVFEKEEWLDSKAVLQAITECPTTSNQITIQQLLNRARADYEALNVHVVKESRRVSKKRIENRAAAKEAPSLRRTYDAEEFDDALALSAYDSDATMGDERPLAESNSRMCCGEGVDTGCTIS